MLERRNDGTNEGGEPPPHTARRPAAGKALFSPKDAVVEHRAERRQRRRTPLWDSHLRRYVTKCKKRKKRRPSDAYTINSYRCAIYRACSVAQVPQWSPNRLRHSAATRIRQELAGGTGRVAPALQHRREDGAGTGHLGHGTGPRWTADRPCPWA